MIMAAPETPAANLDMGVIGNAAFAALIDDHGRIVWSCMPHFDGDPVFCHLLDSAPGKNGDDRQGIWAIEVEDLANIHQAYISNTAIIETYLHDAHGGILKITDFAPRYPHYERFFKPSTICRIVEPVAGEPRMRVKLRPRFNYGASAPRITRGGNHMRFVSPDLALRLTTNAPLIYLENETWFMADKKYTFIFGPDEPLVKSVEKTGEQWLYSTHDYWLQYVRSLAIPYEWQEVVIRSAITLKLCTFEETGAILAAQTASIPEAPDTSRNWDFRYCWLRDSLFVIGALNSISATETMEEHIRYVMNLAMMADGGDLQPLYGIALQQSLTEWHSDALAGYRGMQPVRFGNDAYSQQQNDVWGCVILGLTQSFFDQRLTRPGTIQDFRRLEKFGERAAANLLTPDAGIWELRGEPQIYTFSAMMCWVACDRLARIAEQLALNDRGSYWRGHADHIHTTICQRAWDEQMNSFVSIFDDREVDPSLLTMHGVGFIDAHDPRFIGTVEAIEARLCDHGFPQRKQLDPEFGEPEVIFTICAFWYIEALAAIGRKDEARQRFEQILAMRNRFGLLSEDFDPHTGELWGNFPQTYSMAGLINVAQHLSQGWDTAI
jgi:GH15 family glucan-1,4-alpha-glucosidase